MKFYFFFLIVLITFSCRYKSPYDIPKEKNLIPQDKLENIILESSVGSQLRYSIMFQKRYEHKGLVNIMDSVLKKYGYTHAQFDTTMSGYAANPMKLNEVYEHVLDRLNIMQVNVAKELKKIADKQAIKDSIDRAKKDTTHR